MSDIILEEAINYLFPQYALPWNNFYTTVEPVIYSQKTRQRNVNGRLAISPSILESKPQLYKQKSVLPNWALTLEESLQSNKIGSVLNSTGTRNFLRKDIYKGQIGFLFEYLYNGKFVNVPLLLSDTTDAPDSGLDLDYEWLILHLNYSNNQLIGSQVIIVIDVDGQPYSTVDGFFTVQNNIIPLFNPLQYSGVPSKEVLSAVEEGLTNTLYTGFGNRIFLAVKIPITNASYNAKSTVSYQVQFQCLNTTVSSGGTATVGVAPS